MTQDGAGYGSVANHARSGHSMLPVQSTGSSTGRVRRSMLVATEQCLHSESYKTRSFGRENATCQSGEDASQLCSERRLMNLWSKRKPNGILLDFLRPAILTTYHMPCFSIPIPTKEAAIVTRWGAYSEQFLTSISNHNKRQDARARKPRHGS